MRTLPSVKVFIQKLDSTIGADKLPVLCLPDEPTLDHIRTVLQDGPLGDVERDIFFPSWTRSIHVLLLGPEAEKDALPTWEHIDTRKITVEDSNKLLEVLKKEEETPGSTAIILQECRSKRYTRKKENLAALPFDSSPLSSPVSSRPSSPKTKTVPNMHYSKPHHHQPSSQIPPMQHQEAYNNQVNYDPGYCYDPFMAVGVMPPTSMYPTFYPVHIGMGCYNYSPAPTFMPPVYTGFGYGYNVI